MLPIPVLHREFLGSVWLARGPRELLVILLTRFDGSKILVNLENVKFIETTPDTLVVFVNGDSMFVNESLEEIEQRVLDYKVSMLKKVDGNGDTSG